MAESNNNNISNGPPGSIVINPETGTGNGVLTAIQAKFRFVFSIGEYILLILAVIKAVLRKPPEVHLILKQLYDDGVASLPVVAITGFSTGLVLAAQSFYQLADKGLSGVTGILVGKAMVTELGPVLTAFMVTGRVGAAMCAELGTMHVTEQIDALHTMAVNPNRYLVAPRLMASIFMLPLLTIFSIVMGIYGGYLIAVYFFDMSPGAYYDPMRDHITFFDLFTGMAKAFVFGIFIATICCYKGMTTSGGAAGVGKSTTSSVVISYCCILISNFFLTMGLNAIHDELNKFL
jgi:phospholipid/cholesterol/gamma-HCH transport system permease protein